MAGSVSPWARVHVACFVVVSGGLALTMHSIIHSCYGLLAMVDSFCLHVGVRQLAVENAVENWNLVQVWAVGGATCTLVSSHRTQVLLVR